MPLTPEDASQDPTSALPGTPQPLVTGKQRSRLSIGLTIALVALVVALAAYVIITAIPVGAGDGSR